MGGAGAYPAGAGAASTAAGAVGRLDVASHSYTSVLESSHAHPLRVLAFAHNGAEFVTCAEDGTIRLWDTASGAYRWLA